MGWTLARIPIFVWLALLLVCVQMAPVGLQTCLDESPVAFAQAFYAATNARMAAVQTMTPTPQPSFSKALSPLQKFNTPRFAVPPAPYYSTTAPGTRQWSAQMMLYAQTGDARFLPPCRQ